MGATYSYTITVDNNKTEKEGFDYLLAADPRFINPSKQSRKIVLETFNLDKKFSRAFDLVMIAGHTSKEKDVPIKNPSEITLVELKTTKKKLPANPMGFFFGATENEFALARKLGENYKFCFVSLHPDSRSHVLLTLTELEKRITTKRVQYQINLGNR